MGVMTSVFHLVFGRRGPQRTTAPAAAPPASATAPPPAPTGASVPPPAPQAAAPPPPPAAASATAPEPQAPAAEAPPAPVAPPAAPPAAEASPPAAEPPAPDPAPQPAPLEPAPTTAETQPAAEQQPAPEQPAAEQPAPPQSATEQPATESSPEPAPSERPGTDAPATSETPSAPEAPAPESRPGIVAPAPADLRQLTTHFRLDEFITTSTGLANEPDAEELERIRYTAERLEKVRMLLGGKPIAINSCFRSRAVNEAVGGVENSAHRKGYAVDFTCQQFGTPYQIVEFLKQSTELMSEVDQLIFECSRWVHISFEPRNPCRKQVLTGYYQPGQGRKVFYLPELHQLREDGYLPDAQA